MSIFDSGEEPEEEIDEGEENQSSPSESVDMEVIRDIQDQVKALDSQVESVEQDIETMEQDSEVTETRVQEMREEIDSLKEDISELLGIYDLVASRINPLVSQDIDSLLHDLNNEIDRDVQDFYDLKDTEEILEEENDFQDIAEEIQEHMQVGLDEESREELKNELGEELKNELREELRSELEEDVGTMSDRHESHSQSNVADSIQEPYRVEKIENKLSQEVVAMKWIDTIVSDYDSQTLINVLNYYCEIGRISDTARRQLTRRYQIADFEKEESSGVQKIPDEVHETSSKYLTQLGR